MTTDQLPPSTAQEVTVLVSELVDAWNRNDPAGFAACFHENCEFTNIFGDRAEGRDAIEAMHVYPFTHTTAHATLTVNEQRNRIVREDVCMTEVRWGSEGDRTADGTELPPRNGIIVIVATRENASWRITTGHNLDFSGVFRPALAHTE